MSIRALSAQSMRDRALDIIERRIVVCREEEARQEAAGNALGAATERSAKFEAELLARQISELPLLARDRP